MPRKTKKSKKLSVSADREAKSRKRKIKSPTKRQLKVKVSKEVDKKDKSELLLTLDKKDLSTQPIDYAKVERSKRIAMWAGVTFFMVVILAFWIFNLKTIFRAPNNNASSPQEELDWSKMADEFKDAMEQMKEDLGEFSASQETEVERNIFLPVSEPATTSTSSLPAQDSLQLIEEQITQDEINELKARLEELEDKLNK